MTGSCGELVAPMIISLWLDGRPVDAPKHASLRGDELVDDALLEVGERAERLQRGERHLLAAGFLQVLGGQPSPSCR